MFGRRFLWFVPALVLAAAPLPQACAQERPVYLILPGKDSEVLVRVEEGKAAKPIPVGQGVLYGTTKGKLAIIGEFGGKAVLQIYDAATGKVTLRLNLTSVPIRFASGPKQQILFSPAGDRLCYVSVTGKEGKEGKFTGFRLDEVDLQTHKVSHYTLAKEVANPSLTRLPDAVGIFGVRGCHSLYAFAWQGRKVAEVCSGLGEKDPGPAIAEVVFVPGVGGFRIGRGGAIEHILGPNLQKSQDKSLRSRQGQVVRPTAATLDGKAVLVWGERAAKGAPITRLVVYDPVKGKAVWKKKLSFAAETFTVSPDCRFFYLIDRGQPALVQIDRTKEQVTPVLPIQARPVASSVAVVLVPDS